MVDLDADGDLDILLANENPFDPSPTGWAQKRLLINNGAGIFADETAARLPVATDQTGAMLPGDIDDDGDLDIVVINRGQEFILVNDGEAVFTNETAARFPPTADSSRGGGLADLDGDCDLDRIARSLPATASIADSNSVSAVTRRGAYSPSGSRHYLQQSRVGSARKRLAAAWRGHDARGLTRDAGSVGKRDGGNAEESIRPFRPCDVRDRTRMAALPRTRQHAGYRGEGEPPTGAFASRPGVQRAEPKVTFAR